MQHHGEDQSSFVVVVRLNILYYAESKPATGGPSTVAFYLSRALAKKINLTYYPKFADTPKGLYVKNLFHVFGGFLTSGFDVFHLIFLPSLINGGYPVFRSAKRIGVRTILNIHGIIQLERKSGQVQKLLPNAGLFYTLTSCKSADRIVVNSEFMRTNVVRWYGIGSNKIEVIPNGVDLERFVGRGDRLDLDGDPCILYIGALSKAKGVDVLIKAIAKLRSEFPRMRLHLVGATQLEPGDEFRLQARKEGFENQVVFHDWVSQSMIPRFLKSADICVFPSRLEGFGIVILEAMASGVPIIASDIGSFQEILSNGKNGMLFKSESADALSEAIGSVYRDQSLMKKKVDAALTAVKAYSWENIAERYISLYENLCAGTYDTD